MTHTYRADAEKASSERTSRGRTMVRKDETTQDFSTSGEDKADFYFQMVFL